MAEQRNARVGEPQEIVLPGLGTAGYQWLSDAPAGVRVERAQPNIDTTNLPAGRSVDAVFDVTADAPGTYRITFVHRRPWETDVPPIDAREFDFHVEP
jgi:predicted secreted protein